MTTLNEGAHAGEFLISEGNGWQSRRAIAVLLGQVLVAGAVLGKVSLGAGSSVAGANTGDGTMGAITVGADAIVGDYSLTIKTAAANAGDFEVIDPQGDVVGTGTVGTAFSGGGLSFTLADGAADFVVNDSFTITVAEGSNKYVEHDAAGTDGRAEAVAILFDAVDATAADTDGVGIVNLAEVNGDEITWKTGISAGDKAAAIASLEAKNIIVR